jgi:Fe-S cluster assembly protein SufD
LITDNFIRQERYSNVKLNTLSLENGITRNNYRVGLDGEYAEHILKGLVIADKEQHVDNHTVINHNVPHCHSDELFKYLLSEKSMGAFSGKINVAEDAQKTMAYQNHRNLLDGPDCRVFSKPQLEIYADDVKCSHGMTTGQMDETVLLYMRARGISEKEARMMLRVAFAGEIIEGIGDESLRENLRRWVENRLRTQND